MNALLVRAGHVACVVGATATMAAPADFDPAFGSGGLAAPPYAYSVAGALQPDGALALIVRGRDYYDGSSRIVRVDAHGHLDPAFVIAPTPALPLVDLVGLPDGRLVAMQSVYLIMGFCDTKVLRFLPDGSPDPSFRVAETSACASTLGVSPAGNIFTSYSNWSRVDGSSWSAVLQIGSAGPPIVPRGLQTAGPGGTLSWTYGRVAVTADGEPVAAVALPTPALGVVRLLGEIPDPAFGSAGLASIATLAPVTANDVLVASDGSVLVAGRARWQGRSRIVVAKFTRDGRADPSFGNAGLAAIEVARHGEEIASVRIALQHDGKLLLGSDLHSVPAARDGYYRIALARLTTSGHADPHFAPGGVASVALGQGTQLSFLDVREDGRIVIAGWSWPDAGSLDDPRAFVAQLKGGDDSVARPLREAVAVEYYHARHGHYFVTADGAEIASLDATPASGWVRTGASFRVWDDDDAGLRPVCRFWSDQTWAPKSSHFVTPYDEECAAVKADAAWRYEGIAFTLRLPEGTPGAGACPAGSVALYRAYNNGRTGAPNHRYTTDAAVLDAMLAQGWTMEGEVATRVFACVPPP